jgi:hypothetical protein
MGTGFCWLEIIKKKQLTTSKITGQLVTRTLKRTLAGHTHNKFPVNNPDCLKITNKICHLYKLLSNQLYKSMVASEATKLVTVLVKG